MAASVARVKRTSSRAVQKTLQKRVKDLIKNDNDISAYCAQKEKFLDTMKLSLSESNMGLGTKFLAYIVNSY